MTPIEHTAGPFRWYETLGTEYAVTDLNCRSLLSGKPESPDNAQLLALAPTAPHSCTVPNCPGPENLRKLQCLKRLSTKLGPLRRALLNIAATRRAGPEFDTPGRYSFTNEQDAHEIENAYHLLHDLWDDLQELKEEDNESANSE